MKTLPFYAQPLGLILGGYVVEELVGSGQIGSVYRAQRKDGLISDCRAIKFIPLTELRAGWNNEINKVTLLGNRPEIVRYLDSGEIDIGGHGFRWIAWDYVKGQSLRKIVESKRLTIAMLRDIVTCVLGVLHACLNNEIVHADLHSGNVLIADPDPNDIRGGQHRVFVTDFGYLTSSCGKEMLDDFKGFSRIVRECLESIDFHSLDGEGKAIFSAIKKRLLPDLAEANITEGEHVRNPRSILERFDAEIIIRKSPPNHRSKNVGDYLAAELIGDRFDEWKELFVPRFIGAERLVARNITILTGLRGCGKTMVFRRITALYDQKLGPSGFPGTDGYIGFYLNARAVAEAFPWLPIEKLEQARAQVVHYFHCSWVLEVLRWIAGEYERNPHDQPSWLVPFFADYFPGELVVTNQTSIASHLRAFFVSQLEKARLKSGYENLDWPLSALDFLDRFMGLIERHIKSLKNLPFYMFLDDYSTPLVNPATQRILNSIIFRRSPRVIFKIATESFESIELVGLNGKSLEQEDDFTFIDLATEVLQDSRTNNAELLEELLRPRFERHPLMKGRHLTLNDILGQTPLSDNDFAKKLKELEGQAGTSLRYCGSKTFCSLWSSNVREIIQLFSQLGSLIEPTDGTQRQSTGPLVRIEAQDEAFRGAGAKLRNLLVAATDPTNHVHDAEAAPRAYGEHLQAICDAFAQIAKYELLNKTSINEGRENPKLSRRIEITDVSKDLPNAVRHFYFGLLRYGVFIRDVRGKSARGKAVPRLFFRSLFIPHYRICFSKKDSVKMSWNEFCAFLEHPKEFAEKRSQKPNKKSGRKSKFQDTSPGLL
jgi:serine/threonine protein kinase